MANIQIKPGELSSGVAKTITLNTKDTYVLEDIDVIVKPQAGSFNNAPTTGVTYTENTEPKTILPAGGYLYLNKGWFDDTKISLGHLIPDDVNYTNAGVAHILSGYEAYDTNGKKLIGTMATVTPEFDGGGLTVTPSVTGLKNPTVTVSSSGSFKSATTYGVTTTKPSGTDGTSYLTIDGSGALSTSGSVQATGAVTRAAVLYNGATTGYIDKADDTVALQSDTASKTSAAETIGATITDDFAPLYIPIVSVSGKGGGMTKATDGNSATLSGTSPVISLTYDGKFTDTTGTTYGVTETAPTGIDGTDFLSVSVGGADKIETFTSSTTIKINRAAVTNSGLKRGAINIADGASLLAADSDTFTHGDTFDITATLSNKKSYYIPIIKSMPVSGGGLSQGASSVTFGTVNNPAVTINKSGKFTDVASGGVGASYGVTTKKPATGTDGTNFLQISIGAQTQEYTYTGSASITVNRAAVTHNGAAAGAIKWASGDSILSSGSETFTESGELKITPSVTGSAAYYIPIVSLIDKGTGGEVTASASVETTWKPSKLDYITSGTIIDNGMTNYGVSNTVPTSGDYFSLIINPNLTEHGEVSGTVSGTWSRTAVKSNDTYKGAVSLTADTQFLAPGSGSVTGETFKQTVDINWDATVGKRNWYFTKANLDDITGGSLSAGTLTITSNTTPYVTPDISFLSRTNSTNGSAITLSTYGITETAPTTGNWVVFDPTGTPTDATYTGSVSVTRSKAIATVTKGLTTGQTKELTADAKTYTGTKTISPGVKDGTSRYIPVVEPAASVYKHDIVRPIVKCIENVDYYVNGTQQSSVPAGILSGQTSNPSDFNTASYIKILPNVSTTNGSSTVSASAKMGAGITKGGTNLSTDETKSVLVDRDKNPEVCFIKVYDGSYTLS